MAKSFIQIKGQMDDILETRNAALQKAGQTIAKNFAGGDRSSASSSIDKLLEAFSPEEKFIIMKNAFMTML